MAGAPASAHQADRAATAEIQVMLRHLGYDPGAIDGLKGPRLERAIRGFEADQGLPLTGRSDGALDALLHDKVAAGPSRALLAATAPPARGFWQRHAWPARMGGL
ncbi:MAG: peptidoglycan-binding domain-containing protein [Limimaricola sp.]